MRPVNANCQTSGTGKRAGCPNPVPRGRFMCVEPGRLVASRQTGQSLFYVGIRSVRRRIQGGAVAVIAEKTAAGSCAGKAPARPGCRGSSSVSTSLSVDCEGARAIRNFYWPHSNAMRARRPRGHTASHTLVAVGNLAYDRLTFLRPPPCLCPAGSLHDEL